MLKVLIGVRGFSYSRAYGLHGRVHALSLTSDESTTRCTSLAVLVVLQLKAQLRLLQVSLTRRRASMTAKRVASQTPLYLKHLEALSDCWCPRCNRIRQEDAAGEIQLGASKSFRSTYFLFAHGLQRTRSGRCRSPGFGSSHSLQAFEKILKAQA